MKVDLLSHLVAGLVADEEDVAGRSEEGDGSLGDFELLGWGKEVEQVSGVDDVELAFQLVERRVWIEDIGLEEGTGQRVLISEELEA